MKFGYQTGVATFIQFVLMVVLGVPNSIISIISSCQSNGSDCIINTITSIILFIFTTLWFAFILGAGYFAQKNRSTRFAAVLIASEVITVSVAGRFDLPRQSDLLGKALSLIAIVLGLVIIYIALHVLLARGHRIVKGSPRKRKR